MNKLIENSIIFIINKCENNISENIQEQERSIEEIKTTFKNLNKKIYKQSIYPNEISTIITKYAIQTSYIDQVHIKSLISLLNEYMQKYKQIKKEEDQLNKQSCSYIFALESFNEKREKVAVPEQLNETLKEYYKILTVIDNLYWIEQDILRILSTIDYNLINTIQMEIILQMIDCKYQKITIENIKKNTITEVTLGVDEILDNDIENYSDPWLSKLKNIKFKFIKAFQSFSAINFNVLRVMSGMGTLSYSL